MGKGDKRRPEATPGAYSTGYDQIRWSNNTNKTSATTAPNSVRTISPVILKKSGLMDQMITE